MPETIGLNNLEALLILGMILSVRFREIAILLDWFIP